MEMLGQIFQGDPFGTALKFALLLLLNTVVSLPIVVGVLYVFYFLLTLPLRRNERARFFLDLLELGLNSGQTPEHSIVSVAQSRDRSLGARFHLLAALLERGQKLSDALKEVPRLLPPAVIGMLRAGETLGDIRKVLPACRHLLRDGVSQTRGALNYLLILVFCSSPVMAGVLVTLKIKVLPQFRAVFEGMLPDHQLPAFTNGVFALSGWFVICLEAMLMVMWILVLCYVGGPRLARWLNECWPGLVDRIAFQFPWRRKRLQRDFSALLAVLLDASVPEPEAVRLAAEATANHVMLARAERVRAKLAAGTPLPEALRAMDDSGELHWRIENGRHGRRGFRAALAGWHEALDAKAFQQEQAAAQVATTSLVLINGAMVGAFVIAVFLALISLINVALLW